MEKKRLLKAETRLHPRRLKKLRLKRRQNRRLQQVRAERYGCCHP
jgi:hypothetical protein